MPTPALPLRNDNNIDSRCSIVWSIKPSQPFIFNALDTRITSTLVCLLLTLTGTRVVNRAALVLSEFQCIPHRSSLSSSSIGKFGERSLTSIFLKSNEEKVELRGSNAFSQFAHFRPCSTIFRVQQFPHFRCRPEFAISRCSFSVCSRPQQKRQW